MITEREIETPYFTVENHLNVIHTSKNGLDNDLAAGLFVYLNTNYFDQTFREFSGHTQVNATDLRNMKYPTKTQLVEMGKQYFAAPQTDKEQIFDEVMSKYDKKN